MRIPHLKSALLLTLVATVLASAQIPSVRLKVRESRLFGLSGERFATIELANQTRTYPLTSDNVHRGEYYYFLFRPVGDWKIDVAYVKEELPKLGLYQNERKFPLAWAGEIVSDSAGFSILIGFSKEVKFHQQFLVQFQLGDALSQAEFAAPQEYWPGYSRIASLIGMAGLRMEEGQYRSAIGHFEEILLDPALEIFPQFDQARENRTLAFDRYMNKTLDTLRAEIANEGVPLKERIARLEASLPAIQYVIDSLPNARLGASPSSPAIAQIVESAVAARSLLASTRDSLQHVLDDQNVRWILEGTTTGRSGFLYQQMVEALAYALSSVDFTDTTSSELRVVLPPETKAKLARYELMESFETFLRQCSERFRRREPLIPAQMLENLRRDTAGFSLPYSSMLGAINQYFLGNFEDALEEIYRIFRTSYDTELTGRFDRMRIAIHQRSGRVPPEALRFLAEAERAEQEGKSDVALERYRQASIVAPDFAPAAFQWGKYYVRSGDNIRALTFFQRAYQIDSLYLSAYREACNLYRRGGNFKPMIEVLTYALQHGNDYWETNFMLGTAYMGDGDLARAIQHFERALDLNPNSYQTNIQLGLAHQTVKNYQKAREYFNRAINIDPVREEAVNFLDKLNELQKSAR